MEPVTQVHSVDTAIGVEFHAISRNQHGTGYDLTVHPVDGTFIEMLMYQVICHERSEEPEVSLMLTVDQIGGILKCLNAGAYVASQIKHKLSLN